jgi:hypothetical protein
MGKITLYHPISLTVIRGAALYCNWKIGRIKQTWSDQETTYAEYIMEIVGMPAGMDEHTNKVIAHQFQHCFLDDITVKRVWQTGNGSWQARVLVDLNVVKEDSALLKDGTK